MVLQVDAKYQAHPTAEFLEPPNPAHSIGIIKKVHLARRSMEGSQEEHIVEELLQRRDRGYGPEIQVKWKGWQYADNTWEFRSDLLEDVPDMVAEFDRKELPDAGDSMEGAHSTTQNRESTLSAQTSTTEDVSMNTPDSTHSQPLNTMPPNWKGWAELENDPLIFSTLLREWGVSGVSVREVIPLDAVFDTPVESTLGLIFLSRYVVFDQGTNEATAPKDLWFATQISSFSCATVALMNIINNRSDLQLGDDLQNFKNRTITLSPKDRGLELDNLASFRDVHNSFATENDKLRVDTRLKDDVKNNNARKRLQNRKKGRKGRKKAKTIDDEESGLHFVAFVPAMGQLWRLDGLEREPTGLGRIPEGESWLKMVVPVLEAQFDAAAMNELEFSLLSVVQIGSDAVDAKDEERMRRVREDWGPMMATLLLTTPILKDIKGAERRTSEKETPVCVAEIGKLRARFVRELTQSSLQVVTVKKVE